MKRILSSVIAVLLVAGLLAGCGNNGGEQVGNLFNEEVYKNSGLDFGGLEMPLSENGDTLTWAVNSDDTELNNKWMVQKFREITGVNIQLNILPISSVTEKINTMVASKTLNDIMQFSNDDMAYDMAQQGAIACVEDYIDDIPNFKRIFVEREDTPRIFKSYPGHDGRVYGFYGYDWNRKVNTNAMMYRKDIFDANGIELWNSPETFYQTLKKLKEIYPDSIPFANKTQMAVLTGLSKSWGINVFNPYYDEEEKVWKYSDTTDEFKEILDFVKKLYDEGLMDQEFATRTQADWTSLMTGKNKSFVTLDWIGRMDMFKEMVGDTIPEYDLRFANPVGPTQTMDELSQLCWARYVKKQDPAREKMAFQLLDTVLSPGGAQMMTMGIEGETFVLDENGMAAHPEFETKPSSSELGDKYGMFIENMYLSFDRRSVYFNFTEHEQEAQDFAEDPKNMAPLDPVLAFTAEEKEIVNGIIPGLKQAAEEFAMNYIVTDNTGDAAWEAWKQKASTLGADEVIKVYNQAQARYDAE